MQALIDVFRMSELSVETRVRVIEKIGVAINHEFGANITEDVVKELTEHLKSSAQGIAKSSVQQTEGRLFPAEQNKNSGLPEFDQNPPGGGLRPCSVGMKI